MELDREILTKIADLADCLGKYSRETDNLKVVLLHQTLIAVLFEGSEDHYLIFDDSPAGILTRTSYFGPVASVYSLGALSHHINQHVNEDETEFTFREVQDTISKLIYIEESGILERTSTSPTLHNKVAKWLEEIESNGLLDLASHLMEQHLGVTLVKATLSEDAIKDIENYANKEKD